MIEKLKEWAGQNKVLAIALAGLVALFVVKKMAKKPRRRRSYKMKYNPVTRRRTATARKRSYKTGGAKKKPWQIKGSLAAKRRMAQIRRKRG